MLSGNLNESELSTFLRKKHNEWWQAMIDKNYMKASYAANDIEAAANRICNLTHKKLEEKK